MSTSLGMQSAYLAHERATLIHVRSLASFLMRSRMLQVASSYLWRIIGCLHNTFCAKMPESLISALNCTNFHPTVNRIGAVGLSKAVDASNRRAASSTLLEDGGCTSISAMSNMIVTKPFWPPTWQKLVILLTTSSSPWKKGIALRSVHCPNLHESRQRDSSMGGRGSSFWGCARKKN